MDVDYWNRTFPKYPMTVSDKGWVYGVWYCGTSYQKATLYGEYPATFLKRALALFPQAKNILHLPSGTLLGPGTTIDLFSDKTRRPQIVANAQNIPLRDKTFDLVLSDPPYSEKDSKIYGTTKFPMGKFMKECHRVLKPDGWLGILHTSYPSYRRIEWKLCGLIAVVTGFCRATRMFSIWQPIK